MSDKICTVHFIGKHSRIERLLSEVLAAQAPKAQTDATTEKLRRALAQAVAAPQWSGDGASVTIVHPEANQAAERLMVAARLRRLNARAALDSVRREGVMDSARRWTIRDWRIADGLEEEVPEALRGDYEVLVDKGPYDNLQWELAMPDGARAMVRLEAENGHLKLMVWCPDSRVPSQVRDEADAFVRLTPDGAFVYGGHSDQPGMIYDGADARYLTGDQVLRGLGVLQGEPEDDAVQQQLRAANQAFASYDFGPEFTVVETGQWNTDDPRDYTRLVIADRTGDTALGAGERLSFHVRFNAAAQVRDVYALEVASGEPIGEPARDLEPLSPSPAQR